MEQILAPHDRRSGVPARLISEFGSLPKLLTASAERISQVAESQTATEAVVSFRAAMHYTLRARLDDRSVISNWRALLDYLRADATLGIERFRVLHLDTRNGLMRDEIMTEGTIDQATVHVREVIRRALEIGSASLILVHNHPSGSPTPSRADIDVTKSIAVAGRPLGIAVHDHLILHASGHVSLRANGHI